MRRPNPFTGLNTFFERQQERIRERLRLQEARLKERLEAIGQDRQSRLALTLEGPMTDDWQAPTHAPGPQAPRLDELDRELQT